MTIAAPGEPFIDANGNGQYDSDEYFVDLDYPNAVGSAYVKHAMRRVADGVHPPGPWKDASSDGKYIDRAQLQWRLLHERDCSTPRETGPTTAAWSRRQGMTGGAGTPDIYFDERLVSGAWPPPEIELPRTMISAWETEN